MKYSSTEENLNIATHGFGCFLSIIATFFLVRKAGNPAELLGAVVFGLSLILLYLASTVYHAAKKEDTRARLRIFDHAAIYVLIAGTYTPLCLVTLAGSVGNLILIIIWSVAAGGVVLKLFFTGRFDRISTILYVAMGWIAIGAIKPLVTSLDYYGLVWLFSGGAAYTLGAVLYSIKSIPFNHAIFHCFVLAGSACHFVTVYHYVLGF